MRSYFKDGLVELFTSQIVIAKFFLIKFFFYILYTYLARLNFRILESNPLGLQTFQIGLQMIL
jgi:hypothetical protein